MLTPAGVFGGLPEAEYSVRIPGIRSFTFTLQGEAVCYSSSSIARDVSVVTVDSRQNAHCGKMVLD